MSKKLFYKIIILFIYYFIKYLLNIFFKFPYYLI